MFILINLMVDGNVSYMFISTVVFSSGNCLRKNASETSSSQRRIYLLGAGGSLTFSLAFAICFNCFYKRANHSDRRDHLDIKSMSEFLSSQNCCRNYYVIVKKVDQLCLGKDVLPLVLGNFIWLLNFFQDVFKIVFLLIFF